MFIDPVNYGLWLRNTVTPDAGDMSVLGSVFPFSGSVSRTAAAIRWGIRWRPENDRVQDQHGARRRRGQVHLRSKPRGRDERFHQRLCHYRQQLREHNCGRDPGPPAGLHRADKHYQYREQEFANCGVSIDLEGTSTKPLYNIAIGTNVHQNVTQGVVLKYASGGVVSSQKIGAAAGSGGILIDVGCSSMRVHRQMILGNSTTNMITNNSSVTFSDRTTPPVDIDWHDKRTLPSIASTSTWVNLWTMPIAAYATGFIDPKVTALVQGNGSGSITAKRSFIRGSSGASTVATVGTDTTVGFTVDINFDTTSSVGNVVVQIRLNATTGGTDMNGSATLDMAGDIAGLTRN